MIHKEGSENINADSLSQAKHLDEPTEEENELGEMKIKFASELKGDPEEIVRKQQKFDQYPPADSR